jgi:polyphosphate kinase
MVLFDRSWYNRAGVENVMGFCSNKEYTDFLRDCPQFERLLIRDGIILLKYWFSVSPDVQLERLRSRMDDPLKRWKLSPMDVLSLDKWVDYSKAKDNVIRYTNAKNTPWFEVPSDIKKHARLNCINHLLSQIPYEKKLKFDPIDFPAERKIAHNYVRIPDSEIPWAEDWVQNELL